VLVERPNELHQLFQQEYRHRLYNIVPFYLARILSDLPFTILLSWLFITIVYMFATINHSLIAYVYFCACAILATNAATSFASVISVSVPSIDARMSIVMPVFDVFMFLAGYFLNSSSIPIYLRWLQYVSWYYHAYSLLLITVWHDIQQIPCDLTELCLTNGNDVLAHYDLEQHGLAFYFSMLFLLSLFYHLVAFIILWVRSKR
jgi:hypothetical protein